MESLFNFLMLSLSTQLLPISVITAYLLFLLVIAELINRLQDIDPEFTRKIVHIGTGNVILLAWWLKISQEIILLASIVASVVAIASYIFPILPSVNSVGRKSLGTLFYAISIGILTALFWQEGTRFLTTIGILIMSYGDGMAALIGKKWGKHPYQLWRNKKSWEGSLTMTLVAISITFTVFSLVDIWQWQYLLIATIVGIFATILETFSQLGIDNLTVPVASSLIAYFLWQIIFF